MQLGNLKSVGGNVGGIDQIIKILVSKSFLRAPRNHLNQHPLRSKSPIYIDITRIMTSDIFIVPILT